VAELTLETNNIAETNRGNTPAPDTTQARAESTIELKKNVIDLETPGQKRAELLDVVAGHRTAAQLAEVRAERIENSVIFDPNNPGGNQTMRTVAPLRTVNTHHDVANQQNQSQAELATSTKKKRVGSIDPAIEFVVQQLQSIVPPAVLDEIVHDLEKIASQRTGSEISATELTSIAMKLSNSLEGARAPIELRNGEVSKSDAVYGLIEKLLEGNPRAAEIAEQVAEQVADYIDRVELAKDQNPEMAVALEKINQALASDDPISATQELFARLTPEQIAGLRAEYQRVYGAEMPDPREILLQRRIAEAESITRGREAQLRGAEKNLEASTEEAEGGYGLVSMARYFSGDQERAMKQMELDSKVAGEARSNAKTMRDGTETAKSALSEAQRLEREGRAMQASGADPVLAQERFNQAQLKYSESFNSLQSANKEWKTRSNERLRGYFAEADQIRKMSKKIDGRYATAIAVGEGTQKVIVIGGATVAFIVTLPVSIPAAIGASLLVGTTASVVGRSTKGAGDVAYGLKTAKEAFVDEGLNVVDDVKDVAITTAANVTGVGAAKLVGSAMSASANVLTKVPGVSRAATAVTQIIPAGGRVASYASGAVTGSAAGGTSGVTMAVGQNSYQLATGQVSGAELPGKLFADIKREGFTGLALGALGAVAQMGRISASGSTSFVGRVGQVWARAGIEAAEMTAVVGATAYNGGDAQSLYEAALYTKVGNSAGKVAHARMNVRAASANQPVATQNSSSLPTATAGANSVRNEATSVAPTASPGAQPLTWQLPPKSAAPAPHIVTDFGPIPSSATSTSPGPTALFGVVPNPGYVSPSHVSPSHVSPSTLLLSRPGKSSPTASPDSSMHSMTPGSTRNSTTTAPPNQQPVSAAAMSRTGNPTVTPNVGSTNPVTASVTTAQRPKVTPIDAPSTSRPTNRSSAVAAEPQSITDKFVDGVRKVAIDAQRMARDAVGEVGAGAVQHSKCGLAARALAFGLSFGPGGGVSPAHVFHAPEAGHRHVIKASGTQSQKVTWGGQEVSVLYRSGADPVRNQSSAPENVRVATQESVVVETNAAKATTEAQSKKQGEHSQAKDVLEMKAKAVMNENQVSATVSAQLNANHLGDPTSAPPREPPNNNPRRPFLPRDLSKPDDDRFKRIGSDAFDLDPNEVADGLSLEEQHSRRHKLRRGKRDDEDIELDADPDSAFHTRVRKSFDREGGG